MLYTKKIWEEAFNEMKNDSLTVKKCKTFSVHFNILFYAYLFHPRNPE